jgi:very-short-patch-repair endonuclease
MASPIEDRLYRSIIDEVVNGSVNVRLCDCSSQLGATLSPRLFPDGVDYRLGKVYANRHDDRHCDAFLLRQVRAASYVLDFALFTMAYPGKPTMLNIECDGHEWHERTKQQASSDRARDRELLAMGIMVARFTGSDIFNYEERCAAEVLTILESLAVDAGSVYANAYRRGAEKVAPPMVEEHW